MSTPPTPTSVSRRRDRSRNTGFPEPFGDSYNTTLPHPEADLSPNASISSDPLTATASVHRRRLSMLSKHRRTMSQSSAFSQSAPPAGAVVPAITYTSPEPAAGAASVAPSSSQDGTRSSDEDNATPASPSAAERSSPKRHGSVLSRLRRW